MEIWRDDERKYLPYYHQATQAAEEFSSNRGPPIIVSNLSPPLGMSKAGTTNCNMHYAVVTINSINPKIILNSNFPDLFVGSDKCFYKSKPKGHKLVYN